MPDYPDFTLSALLKGIYDGDPKALAVDSVGNIIAMLKGQYAGSPINLVTDVDGNLFLNLKAQELSELIARFKYGAPDRVHDDVSVSFNGPTTLVSVNGKGLVYSSYITCGDSSYNMYDSLVVEMDGHVLSSVSWEQLESYSVALAVNWPIVLLTSDFITPRLMASIVSGYTFESNLTLKYRHTESGQVTIGYGVTYALI